ncbi:hypothetical protein AMJ52_03750 [candidate division TA06 bacterium DG_78]|uniref:Uncharacterized protein n=1 Tax=candidate division TA06 bacterium DG_78 TaxID=1703772 RepID=A0A0S7YFK1_UNCT6|nr:MAG: hypothetical protein AMJ52_03750 [candidate division TA06 bacterium DG_78]
MKKLIAGLIIVLLLGGIFGFAPMAYADPGGGTGGNGGIPQPPPSGRTDGGASPSGGIPQPPPSGR